MSTETIRTVRDREPRAATSIFTQLLSSVKKIKDQTVLHSHQAFKPESAALYQPWAQSGPVVSMSLSQTLLHIVTGPPWPAAASLALWPQWCPWPKAAILLLHLVQFLHGGQSGKVVEGVGGHQVQAWSKCRLQEQRLFALCLCSQI